MRTFVSLLTAIAVSVLVTAAFAGGGQNSGCNTCGGNSGGHGGTGNRPNQSGATSGAAQQQSQQARSAADAAAASDAHALAGASSVGIGTGGQGGSGTGGAGVGSVQTETVTSTVTNNNAKTLLISLPVTPAVAPTVAASGGQVVPGTCGPLQRVVHKPVQYLVNREKVDLDGQMTDVLEPVVDEYGKVKSYDIVDNGDGTISHIGTIYSMAVVTVSMSTSSQSSITLFGGSGGGNVSNGVSGTLTGTQRVIVTGSCELRKFRVEQQVATLPPAYFVEKAVASTDLCLNAPAITDRDLYRVNGPETQWRVGGADPTFGKPIRPYLQQLGFTPNERDIFMGKLMKQDSVLRFLQNGDRVGNATSGSGKLHLNSVVRFNPIPAFGAPQARDNRMFVYTHDEKVRYNGQCVIRRITLLQPLVCNNWARPDDEILPLGTPPVRKEQEYRE